MRKIYSFALAAVALLSAASCQQELVDESFVDNGDKFTVVASAADTKTVLDGVNTYWTPGDQIVLYNENGEEVTFSTNITETAATAAFTSDSEFVPNSDGLLAVYPKRTDRGATSYADGVITGLHIGGTQTAVAGSFDPKYAVAVGIDISKDADQPHLGFINVHSLVKFTVGGETAPSKVTLKNNGARMIAGMYNLNLDTAEATVTAGAGEITLNGPFEVGKTYYIALVHGVCGDGISLYYDGVEMKNTGKTITLEHNKIYNLGTLPAPAEPEVPTIEEVIAAGPADAAETVGTVVATYTRGALLNDGTAYILIYNGSALDVAVGDKVHVSGKTSMYGGMLQFATGSVVTVLSTGNEVVHPEPVVLDGAGMDDILTKTHVQYIEYTGNLVVSGYYYNVTVDGAATAIGSLQYIDAAAHPEAVDGADIKVRGYFIGVSSGKYVNTMTVSVEKAGASEPEVPAGFKAGNYWIVADNNYANAITSNYGYLNVQAEGTTANVFTFAAVNGGYTLQQADGKYLYMKGTYNSFNVSAELPAEGHIWTVAENADGTYTISNTLNDKYIQYSVGYNSYGCYIDEQGLMPVLVDASGATDGPVEEPEQPEQPGAPVVVTVAEFLEAEEDATVYQLTGVVTEVANELWGNFYLQDATGTVYIYGLCGPAGETQYWAASGVKVGDTITVQTVRSSYNGTPQGKNAIYVSHVAGEGTEPEEPETPVTPEIPEDATGFVMVTSEQADWSGQYLIVWGTAAHATLTNKDLNKTADVTINNGVIAYDSSLDAAVMTVVKNGADYNMTFADGKYFGMQHNGCKLYAEPFALGFEYTADGVKISGEATNKDVTNTYFLYENLNNGSFYRCYVDKKGQKGYTLPTLYKLK